MSARVLEIAETGLYLSRSRGFLVVSKEGEERGRMPLADVAVLMLSGSGNTLSTNVMNALLEQDAAIVICGPNYHPSGMMFPLAGHHLHARRLGLQIAASKPLKKRLWQNLVRIKIANQAGVLEHFGEPDSALSSLVKRVGSGDPENCEAQAARRYWPRLFGPGFRRDTRAPGVNAFLNYGYAVVRAATARAISMAGFHPSLGIHHHNEANSFSLADDLMEPFRPMVDYSVKPLAVREEREMTPEIKKQLAGILTLGLPTLNGVSPLNNCLLKLAQSLVHALETGKPELELPRSPLPLEWPAG